MNQIILGDCIEELRKLEPNSVDLICTDPPYNKNTITAHSRHAVRNLGDLSIQGFFYRAMYDEFARVLKPSGIALTFCDDLFYPVLFASSYHCLQGHGLIVWDKKHISFGRPVRKRHELVMYCSKEGGG